MAGTHVYASPKKMWDFSQLAASQYLEVTAAKAIDMTTYTEGLLEVRYHPTDPVLSSLFSNTNQSIDVRVRSEAPSPDDPGLEFVGLSDLAIVTLSTSNTYFNPGNPALFTAPILIPSGTPNTPPALRVIVRGTQGTSVATLRAILSIDISLKTSV